MNKNIFTWVGLLFVWLSLSGCAEQWIALSGKQLAEPSETVRIDKSQSSNKTKGKKPLSRQAIPNESLPLSGQESRQFMQASNICRILKKYPQWYVHAKRAQRRWGFPAHVQLAIMKQESSFNGIARPPPRGTAGAGKAGLPTSTAYGYAQAKNDTWKEYRLKVRKPQARRDRFQDAIDFMGWYNQRTHTVANIKKHDALRLYLAYHEGVGGYQNKSHRRKPWLIEVAKKVRKYSQNYRKQLRVCGPSVLRLARK